MVRISVGLYMVYCVLDTLPLQYNKLLALLFQIYISETKTKGEKMLLVFSLLQTLKVQKNVGRIGIY